MQIDESVPRRAAQPNVMRMPDFSQLKECDMTRMWIHLHRYQYTSVQWQLYANMSYVDRVCEIRVMYSAECVSGIS